MIGFWVNRGAIGLRLIAFCIVSMVPSTQAAEPFGIANGERIVLVGGTYIERDVRYGCIETLMTAHFSDHQLIFRNLGWSGDEVSGVSRASFDPVSKGYERLVQAVKDTKPTVILMQYGQNESFEGQAGLDSFIKGLTTLLDDVFDTKARVVLISPFLQENLGYPLPDPSAQNENVKLYSTALAKVAKDRGHYFVDMTKALPVSNTLTKKPRTYNGLHFTEAGSWDVAAALMKGLGYTPARSNPEKLKTLRTAIQEKNRLFFNQWRPQNETYLFGFRKHEQGKYAEEIPQFDPLIANMEKKITAERNRLASSGKGN